ncbi:Hypothetical protein D9617_83g071640 [Elsinoe fawcettii]|nr:Hypothetical protein D9617_83g071640 [Elsinoe fawcettii]
MWNRGSDIVCLDDNFSGSPSKSLGWTLKSNNGQLFIDESAHASASALTMFCISRLVTSDITDNLTSTVYPAVRFCISEADFGKALVADPKAHYRTHAILQAASFSQSVSDLSIDLSERALPSSSLFEPDHFDGWVTILNSIPKMGKLQIARIKLYWGNYWRWTLERIVPLLNDIQNSMRARTSSASLEVTVHLGAGGYRAWGSLYYTKPDVRTSGDFLGRMETYRIKWTLTLLGVD